MAYVGAEPLSLRKFQGRELMAGSFIIYFNKIAWRNQRIL
jgi:hypothetical protein